MRSIIGSALVLTLSACAAGGVSVSHQHVAKPGVNSHADYAASLGPTPVVMRNNPVPAATVIAALQRNNERRHMVFTTAPATPAKGYRLLLAFDEPPQGGPIVCSSDFTGDSRPATGSSTSQIYGAFCLGPTLLSEATATAPRLGGPTDPLLGRVMGDLLVALMPANDPHATRGLQIRPE